MHEYLLYAQLPAARHKEVLGILAGLTQQQPFDFLELHMVFAQVAREIPMSKREGKQRTAQAPQPLHYHQLIRDVLLRDQGLETLGWRFRADQMPVAGETEVISRDVAEIRVQPGDELFQRFQSKEAYRYGTSYMLQGTRFVYGNIIIKLHRVLEVPATDNSDMLDAPIPHPQTWRAMDQSGTLVMECVLRTQDNANSTLADRAKSEMSEFKASMAGVVPLHAPDRLIFDPRVKGV